MFMLFNARKKEKKRAGKINNEFNMCETEKACLEESTCVNGELPERERAERAHSDQQLTPFNERENSNCSNSYVYRATRARPTEALSSVPILIPSGFCSL